MATKVKGLGRRTPLAAAAPRVLAARLRDVREHQDAVAAASPSKESVHAMRVATRRLRAALQLFGAPQDLSRELKELQDALGAVRDAQLHARWLGSELRQRTAGLAAAMRRFRAETAGRVAQLELAPRGRLGGHRMRRQLRRKLRAVEDLMGHPLDPKGAHRLRIAVKKLRYRAELLPLKKLEGLLDELEPLQEALGELHDLDFRRTLNPAFDLQPREAKAAALAIVLERWRRCEVARAVRRALR